MFDAEKIAKQALRRAEELEAEKNRRRTMRRMVSLMGSCAACIAVVLLIIPLNNPSDNSIFIGDDLMPLVDFVFPQTDENAKPYTGMAQIIRIPDIGKTVSAAKNAEVAILLHNPEGNAYNFVFEIVLSETGEAIYRSGLVMPGMCIENPVLSKALEEGEYSAVIRIIYETDGSFLPGGVDVAITLLFE